MRTIVMFFRILFSPMMLFILVYLLIGIFVNTAAPHLPNVQDNTATVAHTAHSVIQYIISILGWPLGLWGPTFTFGKWTP